ncbi:hypothetical protein PENSPDRAFT_757538 [Peniophora sp. CONT]|nr:hypothetical protein PENSPDRAFT_757538 [Peniophora sp. CONT]
MSHRLGEPYSNKNPIPKITTGLKGILNPQKATEAKARQMQDADTGIAEEHDDEKQQEDRTDEMQEGKKVLVRDPTTGSDVYIQNAKDFAPEGENILKLAMPEPDWSQHYDHVREVALKSIQKLAIVFSVSFVALLVLPLPRWILYPLALVPPLVATPTFINIVRNASREDADARVWWSERVRGLRAGEDVDKDGDVETEERMRESAEWANNLLSGVWPIMNPSLFDGLVDMLEDIMQASMPTFVHNVRVSDIGLGKLPPRITAVRALPDSSNEHALQKLSEEDREQLTGDHINLEVSFAYRAAPSGSSASSKAQNIHLLIDFFTGVKEVWGFSFPVWVELKGIVGTARVRMQLIPDPPFIKTTMITLLGLPHIQPSVTALSKMMPNIMNLPVISGFVSSALDTAAAEYVAPKSLILDIQRLLGGGDVQKDTTALGVLIVHIHRATGIKGMDSDGASDPYVTLTYTRLGKPLFSTRIIKSDLNPVFEETAAFPIDLNVLKLDERLSIQLWDSDRGSADDMLGYVEVDILELVKDKNSAHRRVGHLISPDKRNRPGQVDFTVGYYAKLPPNPKARKTPGDSVGRDPGLPEDLNVPDPDDQDSTAIGEIEKAVLRCPPDDEWVSGLLAVQIHEVRDLDVGRGGYVDEGAGKFGLGIKEHAKSAVGLSSETEGQKGSDQQGMDEQSDALPSSYCTISLNDEMIYKTRVKPITSSPIFNAGTEKFVTDWRTSHIAVKVMDSRVRENDAVLGIVFLKLSELFVNASQLTRVYHIENGVGHGRARISVVFRPVAAKLPPALRGFNTCTVRVGSAHITELSQEGQGLNLAKCELRLKSTTGGGENKAARRPSGDLVWQAEDSDLTEIPVRSRYGAALVFSFKPGGLHRGKTAMTVLWMRDLVDGVRDTFELPLWVECNDGAFSRLKQNYVPMSGDLSEWDDDKEKLERVGTLKVDLEVVAGMSSAHRARMGDEGGVRMGEEIERVQRAGEREKVGRVPPEHQGSIGASSQGSDHTTTGPTQPTADPSQVATVGHGSRASAAATDASHGTSEPYSTVAHDGHSPITNSSGRNTGTQGTSEPPFSTIATTGHTPRSSGKNTGTQGTSEPPSSAVATTGHTPRSSGRKTGTSEPSSSAVATTGHGPNYTGSGAGRGTAETDFSTRASVGHGQRWHDSASMVLSPTSLSQASLQHRQSSGLSAGAQSSAAATAGHGLAPRPSIPHSTSPGFDSLDGTDGHGTPAEENLGNTFVPDNVEPEIQRQPGERESPEASTDGGSWVADGYDVSGQDGDETGDEDEEDGEDGDEEGAKTKNPIKKLKNWKQNQRELGQEHRGAMQAKPVRTAVWMKDKVEASVHNVKDRFSMEAQQPDIETEV